MYKYKTKPFEHQRQSLIEGAFPFNFAYFMEMGTGKTKVAIDNAAYLFQKEENQNEVMNIRITVIPNKYGEKLTGNIHINYSQKDYKYNMNTSIEYLKKIKNTLLELNTLKDIIMEDKSINDTEIIEYKKKFSDKLESL